MQEINCPQCGKVFKIDESGYSDIVKQVRDSEFNKDLKDRLALAESEKTNELLHMESQKNSEIQKLQTQIELQKSKEEVNLNQSIASVKEEYEKVMKLKDTEIEYYKDYKVKLSTKMVGESLEQHCEIEFNKLRATGFSRAFFEKDSDASAGSKGDYIFRESDENGVEFISIMFEMKNESDTTATKKKNEDFLKELDKDRNEKGCEYAVLVSLLESDSDLYNTGIVDVSHRYPKMYVVRPQFFIPIITLLRNTSQKSLEYKVELKRLEAENFDVTTFKDKLEDFKKGFARNRKLASDNFEKVIIEIDKSIKHLEETKDALLLTDKNLQIANRKLDDLTIQKLTRENPTMASKFKALEVPGGEIKEVED
ncbi:MAG: DUF2130 domain-containing protein [Actinobacteria bacterium]|uniref:Unannotated protein n=1 Tax=freshwater metagenome TaxID=449393 RepID=A0A6J6VPX3_9ZZZZ|nr:DUF2130 domain-containing protein [Actinomycetota bacterium]MSY35424.1 DUF2130 domain-containing protein [Actinomycetota bacterium]